MFGGHFQLLDMSQLEKALDDIAVLLERHIKAEIVRRGLVATGNLLNSIKVRVQRTGEGLSIELEAADYLQHLNVVEPVLRQLESQIERMLEDAVAADASQLLEKAFQ